MQKAESRRQNAEGRMQKAERRKIRKSSVISKLWQAERGMPERAIRFD
jgi:hypothetical protein